MSPEDIKKGAAVAEWAVNLIARFYRPAAVLRPLLILALHRERDRLISGLESGALVPDGKGGIVPATNSRFDPQDGHFL